MLEQIRPVYFREKREEKRERERERETRGLLNEIYVFSTNKFFT